MFGYNSPRYGAWSLDPYGAPTASGIAMGLAQGIGNLQGTFSQNQARALQNQITQGTMPGLISAQNAQNQATTDTADPAALATLKLAQFHANYPLTTMPGMAGQAGAIQYTRDHSGNPIAVPAMPGVSQLAPMASPANQGLIGAPSIPVAQPQQTGSTPINWNGGVPSASPMPASAPNTWQGLINPAANQNMTPISWQANSAVPQAPNAPLVSNSTPQAPPMIPDSPNVRDQFSNANLTGVLGNGLLIGQQNQLANIGWKNALTQSMANRYSPTLTKLQVQAQLQSQGYTPAQAQAIANNSDQSVNVTTNGVAPTSTGNAQQDQLNQQSAAQAADQTQSNILTKTKPAPVLQQAYYSAIAGNLYNNLTPYIPSVSNFATGSGSFDQLLQKASTSSGGVPTQDYNNMVQFKAQVPVLANEIRRQLGGQATDSEQKIMDQLVSPDLWNKNPQQVLGLWNNLGNMINTTGNQLKLSNAQINAKLGQEANVGTGQQPQNQQTQSNSLVQMRAPDGRIVMVPQDHVAMALQNGGQRV